MSALRLSIREARFLAVLASGRTRTTARDASGLTQAEASEVTNRLGLRFTETDRLRDPASIVIALATALRRALDALAVARAEAASARGISARALGVDATAVRAWADANGVSCSRSGRISRATLQAYQDAHPGGES